MVPVEIRCRGNTSLAGGGTTSLLFFSILLLQVCQVIRLEIQLTSKGIDTRDEWMTIYEGQKSTPLTVPLEESFSACLLVMDDNAHLIEWLAYHYTLLPLRRLILGVDPRSKTRPTEILQRWRGRIDITEWSDIDFMAPTLMDAHKQPNLSTKELTKLYLKRQEEFYARCMARLKTEGKTWTALVDTDEYILPNFHSKQHYAYLREKYLKDPHPTVWSLMQAHVHNESVVYSKTANDNRDDPPLEVIVQEQEANLARRIQETPCFPMVRLTFGINESTTDEVRSQIPWGFDALQFQTFRWRWHAGRTSKKINKISKALIDVSRVESKFFVATEQVMVHLPIKEHCQGEDDLWILNGQSLLVVHHYGGTWEQWSHRKDTRGKRTRQAYDRMHYNKQSDDSIRPWLKHFVDQVGWWTARQLLRNVGDID